MQMTTGDAITAADDEPALEDLVAALRVCWSEATSDDPDEWTPERSTRGQCGVTAYVLRAFLGGEILIAPVRSDPPSNEHHAWNRLPDGRELDLTFEQFADGETLGEPWVAEVGHPWEAEIMVTADGVHRGELLLDAVTATLAAVPRRS